MQPDVDFAAGGFARRSYVESELWQRHHRNLEPIAKEFFEDVWADGVRGYPWPTEPLRWWSRRWEYPWVLEQIRRVKNRLPSQAAALDVGPAVTFFSFFLAREGLQLANLDHDEAMIGFFARAVEATRRRPWSTDRIRYIASDARETRLPRASFDVVLSISVLEHVPDWKSVLDEFVRVTKPGGWLILTFDVRLNDWTAGLNLCELGEFKRRIAGNFDLVSRDEKELPGDALTQVNSPVDSAYKPPAYVFPRPIKRLWPPHRIPMKVARLVARRAGIMKPIVPPNLAIYGGVWQRKS